MKNYIEKKGVLKKDINYTTPKGSVINVISATYNQRQGTVEAVVITPCAGGSPVGGKGKIKVSDMPGLANLISAAQARFEQTFLSRFLGIDELLDIIRLHNEAREDFEKMMENENQVTCKSAPDISVEDAKIKYPLAAAYIDILNLADADPSSEIGFIRRQAGEKAIKNIENGEDVITAQKMANEIINKKKETPEYKEHISGL